MILDQADDLRELVRNCGCADDVHPCYRPGTILVIGGKGGVGTTTLAVNLAVALAQSNGRTILAEAASPGGDAALLCANQENPLPDNMHILTTAPASNDWLPDSSETADRVLEKLICSDLYAEAVVIDGGNHPNRSWCDLARIAELVLVVTTADPAAIVGAHAAIKMLHNTAKIENIYTLVNQIPQAGAAENVHQRLHRACRRFLGIGLRHAGYLPYDPAVNAAAQKQHPFVISAPGGRASRHVRALAESLAKQISTSSAIAQT